MSYDKWFKNFKENENVKKGLIKSIESTGAPLEFRAGRIFSKQKYYSRPGYYFEKVDGNNVTKEIDLLAHRKIKELKTEFGFNINVIVKIVAECKFHYDRDLLVFGLEDEIKANTVLRFPVFTNGTTPIYSIQSNTMTYGEFVKLFKFSNISRRIVDVKCDCNKFEILKSPQERETSLYNASEQLIPALNFQYNNDVDFIQNFEYMRLCNIFQPELEEAIKESKNVFEVIEKFKRGYTVESFNGEGMAVNVYLPMVIVNEETGLFNVVFDEKDHSIKDLEEIKWCLYLHHPQLPEKYPRILELRYEQPILVCNIKYLEELIDTMESSVSELAGQMLNNLNRHQDRIIEEVIGFVYKNRNRTINS